MNFLGFELHNSLRGIRAYIKVENNFYHQITHHCKHNSQLYRRKTKTKLKKIQSLLYRFSDNIIFSPALNQLKYHRLSQPRPEHSFNAHMKALNRDQIQHQVIGIFLPT